MFTCTVYEITGIHPLFGFLFFLSELVLLWLQCFQPKLNIVNLKQNTVIVLKVYLFLHFFAYLCIYF